MPLGNDVARQIISASLAHHVAEQIQANKDKWDNEWGTQKNPIEKSALTIDDLASILKDIRKQSLDRYSCLITQDHASDTYSDDPSSSPRSDTPAYPSPPSSTRSFSSSGSSTKTIEPFRVFPSKSENIESDIGDIFARGIDSARAVLEILPYIKDSTANIESQLGSNDDYTNTLIRLINAFKQRMSQFEPTNLTAAVDELNHFNGALVDLLMHKCNGSLNKNQAKQAINFVRDFLWKRDFSIANSTIEPLVNPEGATEEPPPITIIRYASPMRFNPNPLLWSDNQTWKTKLKEKVGAWVDAFLNAHREDIQTRSSTPMSRYTPNLSNAFDCTDIIVRNNDQDHPILSHHTRIAISEPLDVGNTSSRQDITDWNHEQLIDRQRLESELNAFMDHWGFLFTTNEEIPFTMLHQTLVADEVTFAPDQTKAKESKFAGSVIDSKLKANDHLRNLLKTHTLLRNKTSGNITIHPNSPDNAPVPIPKDCQKVNIDVLETNLGINLWNDRTRVRNNDINDGRQLIANAVMLFEKVRDKPFFNNNQSITTVINFLKSEDHSLISPFKFRGDAVKRAIQTLTQELKNGSELTGDLTPEQRENLALTLAAAVELKCTVHETWLGSARRNVANFSRDYLRRIPVLGHLADWSIRGTMTLVAALFKLPGYIPTFVQRIRHFSDRKELYRASYEGLLAESLGSLQGGCMSALDRAGEMAEQRMAMKKQFAQTGKMISYNDDQDTKATFYKTYGSTQAKHNFVHMATGTSATQDSETRGPFWSRGSVLAYVGETQKERDLSNRLRTLRHGKYSDTTTQEYLHPPLKKDKVALSTYPVPWPSRLAVVVIPEVKQNTTLPQPQESSTDKHQPPIKKTKPTLQNSR